MNKETIEKIQTAIDADDENQKDFRAYDDMDMVRYDFGNLLEDWMVPRRPTDGQETLKALGNIFDTHNPVISILPFGEEDKEGAERAERWAEFHLMKINQRAGKSPIRKIPHMAGKYNRVCAQVDYLPYWIGSNRDKYTREQKEQMRGGPFCVELHNPQNVYYGMGKYGLQWVAVVTNMTSTEIRNHWNAYEGKGEEGKKIKSALSKIEAKEEETEDIRFVHVDFTSFDKREVSVFETTKEDISDFCDYEEDAERIDILDVDNKLDFLNWVIVEGDSTPILAGIHKSGLYSYKAILDTVVHSSVMRRAYPPLWVSHTLDGRGVDVDMTGADPEARLKPGETLEPAQPPALDNAVFTLSQQVAAQVDGATSVKRLANMDVGSNIDYSTVITAIELQLTSLEPYKRVSEKAATGIVQTMFKWIAYTKNTEAAYRSKITATNQPIGQEILMGPEDFDTDRMLVEVQFTAKTDKMSVTNQFVQLKQAGVRIPDKEFLPKLGFNNPEVLSAQWEDEQLQNFALQMYQQRKQQEMQMEFQAQQMQMQAEFQQQQQQAQMEAEQQAMMNSPEMQGQMGQMANPDQSQPMIPQGSGFDTAQGGQSPMTGAPGMTATQIPGERAQ